LWDDACRATTPGVRATSKRRVATNARTVGISQRRPRGSIQRRGPWSAATERVGGDRAGRPPWALLPGSLCGGRRHIPVIHAW